MARTQYFNNCVRYGVQPDSVKEDGELPETEYFDEEQLKMVTPSFVETGFNKFKNKSFPI